MSAQAVTIFCQRVVREEGNRTVPYDDATGKPVTAPVGNLSWGYGFNLAKIGSTQLFDAMVRFIAESFDTELSKFDWYVGLASEPTRQSVFLDVAYNDGVGGLLHFPKMIAFAAAKNWQECAAECSVVKTNPKLDASRYGPLRLLIMTGDSHT